LVGKRVEVVVNAVDGDGFQFAHFAAFISATSALSCSMDVAASMVV
jgi:hypothetical protein